MAFVNMRDMLNFAYQNKFAIAAFEIVDFVSLEAAVLAAQHCDAPVILDITEAHVSEIQFEILMASVKAIAEKTPVPMAVHLNDGINLDSVVQAINSGCNGVMVDTSYKSLEDNIEVSREIVRTAHNCGVAGVGCLPLNASLNVDDVVKYVSATGLDALYLSAMTELNENVDGTEIPYMSHLRKIRSVVRAPISMSAGQDFDGKSIQFAIDSGLCKLSFECGHYANEENRMERLKEFMQHCISLVNSNNRSASVLYNCSAWSPIDRLVIFNVSGILDETTSEIMKNGQQLLSSIPGVLRVDIGQAITVDALFRYTWLVRFCHENVIESYHDHPIYRLFSDELFKQIAVERISIDSQII